jgi:uncharacterized protein with transglutaminase domain
MKNLLAIFTLVIVQLFILAVPVYSQNNIKENIELATSSAEATESAEKEATTSSIVKKIVEKEPDITEPKPEVKGKLERYLEDNPVGPLNPFNVVRHAIRYAVSQGVPANTLVLMLLFPLVATVVVFARHIIGLKSFGIFTPALISVAFLTTGLATGIMLFSLILIVATVVRMLLKRIRIQYLPRMAVFMLFISLSIFGTLLISPSLGSEELINIGIFPILILILLVEDFLDLQITRNLPQALMITLETIILAIACFYLMNWEMLQKFALVNPEAFTIIIFASIVLIEQYSGLRLLEIWRFKKLLK